MARVDVQAIKQNTDLVELAKRHTELKKVGPHEYAGPCPKCGGDDRFHVKPTGWFCRQCHSFEDHKWGDAIEFVRWMEGVDFKEACARLSAGSIPTLRSVPTQPRPRRSRQAQKRAVQTDTWIGEAEAFVQRAAELLLAPEGEPGRAYLQRRGLEERTWRAYCMGYTEKSKTKEQLPAIVLPWYAGRKLTAVRFRFLEASGNTKIKSLPGSKFAGQLYGGQALQLTFAELMTGTIATVRTLVLCEGEINAASIWQVAGDTQLDVLSLGSESANLSPAIIAVAEHYGTVLTWFDRREVTDAVAAALTSGAHAIESPKGKDANDWLREGHLGGLLSTARHIASKKSYREREALLWALWDAAYYELHGIDSGTAQVVERLANELEKSAPLQEVVPGRWKAGPD